jgi:hypothetical protein
MDHRKPFLEASCGVLTWHCTPYGRYPFLSVTLSCGDRCAHCGAKNGKFSRGT